MSARMRVSVDRGPRGAVQRGLDALGFVPTASKLYAPPVGLVPRRQLVETVSRRAGDVIAVTAPAGFGKSTFLAELAAGDARPAAWVSLTGADNDPGTFLAYVALALDEIEPIDPDCVCDLLVSPPFLGSRSLQQFGSMLADRRQPFVLVLDDIHELVARDVLDILPVLVGELPAGSAIAFGARSAIPLPLGRLRVRRRLVEVGPADLAFDADEARALFEALGVGIGPRDATTLLERTEGWPVALYLAAQTQGIRSQSASTQETNFGGDHRFVVEFLAEELMAQLDEATVAFLLDASCLERLSGPLCDDVLERNGSGQLLDDLQQRTLLVIPLDDNRTRYRFHHLLSEYLQSELARKEPARHAYLHRRASAWFDAHGDADAAVTHAALAGDLERAESLIMRWFATVATAGRHLPITDRWVKLFPEPDRDRRPQLMILAAWGCFHRGEPGATQWLERAAAALPERYPEDVHGLAPEVALAMARMIIAPLGPQEMTDEATYVHAWTGMGDGHPIASLALGAAAFMRGDETEAVRRLREGADTTIDRPIVVASCLAHLAIVDIEHGRWAAAEGAARRARGLIGDATSFAITVLVLAVGVLVAAHAGRDADARHDDETCRQHLAGLLGVAPWLNLQARVALARAALLGGRRAEAAVWIDESEAILASVPGAAGVARQVAALKTELSVTHDRTHRFGALSLTTAELRVLRFLPTHLSIAEIADRLHVSRNTVKSQTVAIYRKLGTSSRSGAIELAVAAGLLEAVRIHR